MKDLNFFNHYTESKKFKIENIYYLFILFLLISIFFYSFINQIKINNLSKKVSNLKTQVENEEIKTKVNKLKKEKDEINKVENNIKQLNLLDEFIKKEDKINEELIKDINLRIPENVFLISIEFNLSSIEIKGISGDKLSIAQLEHNLNEIKSFKNVFISNIYFEENHYSFSLSVSLKDEDVKDDGEKDEIK